MRSDIRVSPRRRMVQLSVSSDNEVIAAPVPNYVPRSVGAATEALLGSRDDPEQLMRVFDRSRVPMVMIDDRRRYVEANGPARLAFRLGLAELRSYTINDLTAPEAVASMEAAWTRLLETGTVAGSSAVAGPDGGHLDVVHCGVANALPGLHLVAFAPAGWSEDELSFLETDNGDQPLAPLTPREREVLQLAAEGLTGPKIGESLFVSAGTVKTHFGNVYKKLGVRDRAAAVARGLRLGLIV
jgi:DNA-binding CsgD family transcriptional regulator